MIPSRIEKERLFMTARLKTWMVMAGLVLVLAATGCAHFEKLTGSGNSGPSSVYDQFEDILIPTDLKYEPKQSFIYETSGFKAGRAAYSGYVEIDSLVAFFSDAMVKDGWRLRSTFKSPKIIILFEKQERVCIITVEEKMVFTHVEIWVAPTV